MRICAVDWSGRLEGAEEAIWLAEAEDGRLVDLRNGLGREQVVARLIDIARDAGDVAVGLDFAFLFPRWWCQERGWTSVRDVWEAMEADGEKLLETCAWPFWGRSGTSNPHGPDRAYRRTEREAGAASAKSVFQVGGAGAVGTGSIRGMPHLLTLAGDGFSVWPFDAPSSWRVVEIYPRALTGPVRKNRWSARHAYLSAAFGEQPERLLERAAGSEDAFDAAVSAIVMSRHEDDLRALEKSRDPTYAIEGRIWNPSVVMHR